MVKPTRGSLSNTLTKFYTKNEGISIQITAFTTNITDQVLGEVKPEG